MVDQQMKNGAFNGSFLFLNLSTNTLGVGSSFTQPSPSESFQQIPKDNISIPPNTNEASNDYNEGSLSSSETSKTKKDSEGEEDPDWVPEKKARKCSSSAKTTDKLKRGPSIGSNPPQISSGGFDGMLNCSSGPPPPYLMSLLGLFGWKVVLQPGKGDYVYVSPAGIPYFSLPKAFETFLHGTSKYSQSVGGSSRYLGNMPLGGSLVQGAAASSSYLGVGGDNAADGSGRKAKGRRKKNSNAEKNIQPVEPIKEQLHPKVDPLIDNGKKSLQMAKSVECQEASQASPSRDIIEKTKCYTGRFLGNEFNQGACSTTLANGDPLRNGKLPRRRRSGRTIGRHVQVQNRRNELSGSSAFGDKPKHKEQTLANPRLENMLKERPEACRLDLNKEARNSHCNMGVMKSSQRSRRSIAKTNRLDGLRRSGRLNKTDGVLDREMDAEKQAVSTFQGHTKSLARTNVRKEVRKSAVSEGVSDESMDCSTDDENSHGESDISDMQGCHDTTRIRRSTRINGKRVPVDDNSDSDVDFRYKDHLLYHSEIGTNIAGMKDKEKPMTSSHKVNDGKASNPASADMLTQINMSNSGWKRPNLNKPSAALKERNIDISISEKSSPSFAAKGKLVGGRTVNGQTKKKRRGGCALIVRRNRKADNHEEILSQTKINILSWLIDSGTLTENEKVYCITNTSMGNTPGFVTRTGIWCNCCNELVSLSKFVAHTGGKSQQPWDNIFLLSGKTLLLCLKEAWEKEKIQRKYGFRTVGVGDPDPSDDTCGICADGGHLICCDSCPSTFHQTCLMLKTFPEGNWYCPCCTCKFCMATVRGSDMLLDAPNLFSCKQCGRKYHKDCAWGANMHFMDSVPFSFCGEGCQKVATELLDMLGVTNPIADGFSWTMLKCFDEDAGIISNQRLSFIMESNVKLSMALSVLNECFDPLIDQRTGVDMICQATYNCGSNFNRLNYEGFCTLILERDEEIISAASLRLHGTSLAEMPFIGTRPMYRRQGMCRRLLKAVEDMLCSLHVEKLIIPAIPDMLKTWTTSFSFKTLDPSHKDEIKNLSLMVFAETTLLYKPMLKPMINTKAFVNEDGVPFDGGISCEKNIQENNDLQRSFGDQLNCKNNVGVGENVHGDRELQRSFGGQRNTGMHFGSGMNMQQSHELHRSFDTQINARSHLGLGKNVQGVHELQRTIDDWMHARMHFGNRKDIQETEEGHELQTSFGDRINTRSHCESRNNIHESHDLQRSFVDRINTAHYFIDNGVSYGESIQNSHELPSSFGDQINTRSHFGSRDNLQESHDLRRSFVAQLNSRGHFGNVENIQENRALQGPFGDQINLRSHFGSAKSLQETHDFQGSSGDQIHGRSHFGSDENINESHVSYRKNIQVAHEVQRSFGDQIDARSHFTNGDSIQESHRHDKSFPYQIYNRNHFGGSPDWYLYECILKGQTESTSQTRRIMKDTSITPSSLGALPSNLSNGSTFEASPPQNTYLTNFSTLPHNIAASATQGSLSIQPPITSHGLTSEASPFEPLFVSNVSTLPHNATSKPMFPFSSIVCDTSDAAPNNSMNNQSQGALEVKDLQMDAIRSSISFDNLLNAIS